MPLKRGVADEPADQHDDRDRDRSGFHDIGQGAFGLWFKFVGENVPYLILPYFVLYAIYYLVDHLTRQAALDGTTGDAGQPSTQQRTAVSTELTSHPTV